MRPNAKMSFALITSMSLLAIGCASTPKETGPGPAPVETPAPAQLPPVRSAPPVQVAPVSPVTTYAPPTNVVQGPPGGSIEEFRVSAGDRIFFETDRFDLGAEAQSILRRQAAWLVAYPSVRVLIAGNADERGTREYNLALGERRAQSTKDFLTSLGVDPSRLATVSYGKERPIDGRSSEEGWAVNRNAQTQIVSGATS